MNTDHDLDELHRFRADTAEPGQERLNRIRFRVINTANRANAKPRRPLLVPGIVAASVLAIAAGATVVFSTGSAPSQDNQPAVAPAKPKTAHQEAVALLEGFADATGTGPAPLALASVKLLYVKGSGMANNSVAHGDGPAVTKRQTYKHEMWLSPNGFDPVKIVRTDDGHAEDMPLGKDNEQHQPVSLTHPTADFLAQLPTDPGQLLSLLTKEFDTNTGKGGSADYRILEGLHDVLYRTEPTLRPELRAGLYRALATLESITSTGKVTTVDGHDVYVISVTETMSDKTKAQQDLLLDARTGRPVGSRSFFGDDLAKGQPSFYDLWSYAVVDKAGATR